MQADTVSVVFVSHCECLSGPTSLLCIVAESGRPGELKLLTMNLFQLFLSKAMTHCLRHECCCFAMLLQRQICLLSLLSVSKLVKANGVGHLSACLLFKICYDFIDLVLPIICSFKLQHSNNKVSMSSCSCSIMHDKLLLLVPYFGCEEHSGIFLANAAISNLHSKSAAFNMSKDIATNELCILVCSNVYCIDQHMLL